MTNQIIGLIGGRKVLPRISPSGLSMNKRTTVWRRYHQSHMPLLAFCHVDQEPRLSPEEDLRINQLALRMTLLYSCYFYLFYFLYFSVCVWRGGLFTGTQNWQPRASPAMSCERWKVGCGGCWGGGGREGLGADRGANVFQMWHGEQWHHEGIKLSAAGKYLRFWRDVEG